MKRPIRSIAIMVVMILLSTACDNLHSQNNKNEAKADSTAIKLFQQNISGKGHWVASDGAISIPLADGRTLWNMGDSHIGHYDSASHTVPCLFQVRNCALVQQKGNWEQLQTLIGTTYQIKSFYKNSDIDSVFFWPGHGFQLGDTVYVYQTELRNTGTGGAFGFEATGKHYFAKLNPKTLQITGYQPLADFGEMDFSIGFVKDSVAGYIYSYGYSSGYIESNIHLARIPYEKPWSAWQFWNGSHWTSNPDSAVTIAQGASNGSAAQKWKNKYVLISTEFSVGCDQGKALFAATATQPYGPFTDRKAIYTITDTLRGHYPFWYTPAIHPQFAENDEILITYCINGYGDCVETCVNNRKDPDVYRPRAIRVPFAVLP